MIWLKDALVVLGTVGAYAAIILVLTRAGLELPLPGAAKRKRRRLLRLLATPRHGLFELGQEKSRGQ